MQALNDHIAKDGFRLRGISASRVDGFSDVVFGFALTLLVVSLEVPHTYAEFHAALLQFFPFSICFLFLILIWWTHYRFFRRFGLHDSATIVINCILLFAVLFYVYPLKFLFTIATLDVAPGVFTAPSQMRELMIVYGVGFTTIYLCFAALYANAWRQRESLGLNPLERVLTASSFWHYIGDGSVGILCCLLAALLPLEHASNAGWGFLVLFPWGRIHGLGTRRYLKRARAQMAQEEHSSLSA